MFKRIPTTANQYLFRRAAWFSLILLSSLVFVSAQTNAQTNVQAAVPELAVKLHLERSAVVDGKEKMVVTERAAPGETLQYIAVYSNQTHLIIGKEGKIGSNERVLKAVTATMPIPNQMVYLGKASPTPQQGSSDGKNFASYPLTKVVKLEDGTVKTVPLEWAAYRALRWTLSDIPPKMSNNVTATVQVNQQLNTAP